MEGSTPARAVLFDLFGTLLVFPSFDLANAAWVHAFHDAVGGPYGLAPEETARLCAAILEERCDRDEAAGLTTYQTKIRRAVARFGAPPGAAELAAITRATLDAWQRHIRLADESIAVLSAVRRSARTVLVSNFDHAPHVRRVLAETGLAPLFDAVVISDDVGISKPAPEIFEIALRLAGVAAHEAIHVGDSVRDDVEGARAAGVRPVLVDRRLKSHADWEEAGPTPAPGVRRIGSLRELVEPAT